MAGLGGCKGLFLALEQPLHVQGRAGGFPLVKLAGEGLWMPGWLSITTAPETVLWTLDMCICASGFLLLE